MPEALSLGVGERIGHPDFRPGKVRVLNRSGRMVTVMSDAISQKSTHTARQTLEALRTGVVPRHHLETYTIGRDAELTRVRRELVKDELGGTFLVVFGDYGTGKTQFLELAENLALDLNYLTARVTLDSREVLPCRPRRLYRSLARSIRYPDLHERRTIGLSPLLERAASDRDIVKRWNDREGGEAHPYLGPVLAHLSALAADKEEEDDPLRERLMGWIQGEEVASNVELCETLRRRTGVRARLYALRDHRTVTHLYTLILGGLAELARHVGYAGLLITVDEAEFYSALRTEDREFAEVLLMTFAAACLDEEDIHFDPAGLSKGGAPVHRGFGYRYKEKQALHAIFALTHDPTSKELIERIVNRRCFLELSPFGLSEYRALVDRVLDLYRMAGLELQTELVSPIARVMEACHDQGVIENPRQALKFVTEIVDIAWHAPSRLEPVLVELMQRLDVF